jgi:hypothetical protein
VAAIDRLRIALIAGFAAGLVAPDNAAAQSAPRRLSSAVMVYSDDDNVTVISPRLAGQQTLGPWSVEASAGVDMVTAASVDLVTAASPKGFSEERWQANASALYRLQEGTAARSWYGLSKEPDFVSHQVGAGAEVELWERHSTAGVSYTADLSTVGRAHDPLMAEARNGHLLQLSWQQVMGAASMLDLAYSAQRIDGYQASPYRYVRLYAGDSPMHASAVTEAVPTQRHRQTLVLGWRQRLSRRWFAAMQMRGYTDDWGMRSLATTLRATCKLSDQWTLDSELRGHGQSAVTFYQRQYNSFPQVPSWRTADKELGPMTTAQGGVHLEWAPLLGPRQPLRLGLGVDVIRYRYLDYAWLAERTALVTLAHVTWEP